MGILMGWIFLSLDGSIAGIRSRTGAALRCLRLTGLPRRDVRDVPPQPPMSRSLDRERTEGVVGVPAFMLSRRIAKLIEDVPVRLFSPALLLHDWFPPRGRHAS